MQPFGGIALKTSSTSSLVLALETSQRQASVALRDVGGAIHEEKLSTKARHDDDLLPAIDRVFARAGLRPEDLRAAAVCVSIGPGGFTGLRIAVATAKMLAEALQVGLVAVPSALVAGEAYEGEGPIIVALACKGEAFWLTRLEREGAREAVRGRWTIAGTPGIAHAESFDLAGIRAVLADEYFPDAALRRVRAARVPLIAPAFSAHACLAVGARMLEGSRGETIDPLHLLPLYPRQAEAVTLWERRGAKPAATQAGESQI